MIIYDYRDKLWDLVIGTESGLQQNRDPAFFLEGKALENF